MTLAYNYSQEDDSTYAVSFVTNVNIRGLQFLEEDARRKNLVSLVLVAFDENDRYINGLEKSIDFRLQESSYASLRDHGLTSRVELQTPDRPLQDQSGRARKQSRQNGFCNQGGGNSMMKHMTNYRIF